MIKLLLHFLLFSLRWVVGHLAGRFLFLKIWSWLKKKYRGLKMKYRTLKLLRRRRNARKRKQTTDRGVQALIIGLALVLVLLVGCSGVKHIIQLEEPTDHTSGDDGGKIKYKIIWGDINQKE